ncbi:MAG: DUF2442 domain-containing protein [Oscillospiraceae bacterium]|nr:DUF2442 domain-containing protein [Oscillospiraceae bacterium]
MDIPKIVDVKPIDDLNLIITFDGGIVKRYDVKKLFNELPVFKQLENKELFESVRVEVGGVAIVWNDDIDLAEYEIWKNGETV